MSTKEKIEAATKELQAINMAIVQHKAAAYDKIAELERLNFILQSEAQKEAEKQKEGE